jgi:ABC-type transport system substrate-binding protein
VVEAAYKPLGDRASSLDPARFDELADQIDTLSTADPPDCESTLAAADELLTSAGLLVLPRDGYTAGDGSFNACVYAEATRLRLESVAASLRASGLDAISLAYRELSFNQHPVGTGPLRFVATEEGARVIFDAFDGYHFGRPAATGFDARIVRDPGDFQSRIESGEFDWAALPAILGQVKDQPGRQIASYPETQYYLLAYNLRPGMLFADHALRSAVELCIDKPATVDAATNGTGDVIYSPIDPISWAFQPDLRHPERDVEAAKDLVESSGWTLGNDGIYERDGGRLAADVYVGQEEVQRTTFVDLVAQQVLDCGIEFNVIKADGQTVLGVVPKDVVDNARALVLRLGCLTPPQ